MSESTHVFKKLIKVKKKPQTKIKGLWGVGRPNCDENVLCILCVLHMCGFGQIIIHVMN